MGEQLKPFDTGTRRHGDSGIEVVISDRWVISHLISQISKKADSKFKIQKVFSAFSAALREAALLHSQETFFPLISFLTLRNFAYFAFN